MEKRWFVLKIVCEWVYVDRFDMNLWVETLRERVSDYRTTREDANEDFARLGFVDNRESDVKCHDDFSKEGFWVRHIVQCKSI